MKAEERRFIVRKQHERRLLEPDKNNLLFKVRGKLISQGKIDRWSREEAATTALHADEDAGGAHSPRKDASYHGYLQPNP